MKIGEIIPEFKAAFNGSEFLKLAEKIHGRLPMTDVLVPAKVAEAGVEPPKGDRAAKEEGGLLTDGDAADARVTSAAAPPSLHPTGAPLCGGDGGARVSGLRGGGHTVDGCRRAARGDGEAAAMDVVEAASEGLPSPSLGIPPINTVRRGSLAQDNDATLVCPRVSGVSLGGGAKSPLLPADCSLNRSEGGQEKFAALRSTPEISLVRRLPVRGSFLPQPVHGGEKGAGRWQSGHGGGGQLGHGESEVFPTGVKLPSPVMGVDEATGGAFPDGARSLGTMRREAAAPPATTVPPAAAGPGAAIQSGDRGGSATMLSPSDLSTGTDSIRFGSLDFKLSSDDSFAAAFLSSSRTCCQYVAPEIVDGHAIVRPAWSVVEQGRSRWSRVLVGYFLGRKVPFFEVQRFVMSIWKGVASVKANSNGFYFFEFETDACLSTVLEGGPWMMFGQPLFLERWKEGMSLTRKEHKAVPVWVRMRGVPLEYWTTEGLSVVASAVGRPLYPDAFTSQCVRIDYARVCVMMDVDSPFRDHFFIVLPSPSGEVRGSCRVEVEYEWRPHSCTFCHAFGHRETGCPMKAKPKQTKPVRIFVHKPKQDNGWTRVGSRKEGDKAGRETPIPIPEPVPRAREQRRVTPPPQPAVLPRSNQFSSLADPEEGESMEESKGKELVPFRRDRVATEMGDLGDGGVRRDEETGSGPGSPVSSAHDVVPWGPIGAAPRLATQ